MASENLRIEVAAIEENGERRSSTRIIRVCLRMNTSIFLNMDRLEVKIKKTVGVRFFYRAKRIKLRVG
jgi:hypothetical protein